eukprot:11461623-Ditylum_brightwellii.AAC.1
MEFQGCVGVWVVRVSVGRRVLVASDVVQSAASTCLLGDSSLGCTVPAAAGSAPDWNMTVAGRGEGAWLGCLRAWVLPY